jgi:hypothetical protein
MGRPLKIAKASATVDTGFPSTAVGVVGGDTAQAGNQIQVRARVTGFAEGDGYIVRQKGASKFLVTVGGNTGVVSLVDKADSTLAEGECTITLTKADTSTVRAKRISSKFAIDFSDVKYILGDTATIATTPDTVTVESA